MTMTNKLFVANLAYKMTEEDLETTFGECGSVIGTKVVRDFDSGQSKGFGFVEMATADEAKNAIETLNGVIQYGRPLTVLEAKPREGREGREARPIDTVRSYQRATPTSYGER